MAVTTQQLLHCRLQEQHTTMNCCMPDDCSSDVGADGCKGLWWDDRSDNAFYPLCATPGDSTGFINGADAVQTDKSKAAPAPAGGNVVLIVCIAAVAIVAIIVAGVVVLKLKKSESAFVQQG